MKSDNDRLGLEVEKLKEQLEREELARCQAEQELMRVNQEKKDLETVMQGVQCTVYRAEGGERPYLVAKIVSPNKDLVSGFCNDLRNLKIIEDYYCASPGRNGGDNNTNGNNNTNGTRRARRLTAGIGDEGWTNLFEEGLAGGDSASEAQGPGQGQGQGAKPNNKRLSQRRRRKRTDSVTIEDGDGGGPQENGGGGGGGSHGESDDDEPVEGELNGGDGRTVPSSSNGHACRGEDEGDEGDEEDDMGVMDGDVEECLIRRAASQGDKSACEAALALRNEVVTLELSSENGSWRLPVHFAACLNLLGHYLKDYGVIPSFKWPYSSSTQEKTAHATN